jgi:hypothetical protein
MMTEPRAFVRRFAALVIAFLWVAALLVIAAAGAEWYLEAAKRSRYAARYGRIDAAYASFRVQHINPFYLFFFPLEAARRAAMGNDVCSVGPDGFRGPGPEAARGRKLAFVLGGSAAFGYDASSNDTTITGYLNRVQSDYHFVNAGVPSWNSSQEMIRLVHQILAHRPDLVIAYDGANDAAIVNRYERWGFDFPAGTPETFETLYSMVDDLRAGGAWLQIPESLLPRLTRELRTAWWEARSGRGQPRAEAIERAAAAYRHNLEVMNDVVSARGGRFIGIFQPIRSLHRGVPDAHRSRRRLPVYREFHALVTGRHRPAGEYHDFATYFDTLYAQVPSIDIDAGEDVGEDTVFLDDVHLFDPGNRLIALAIRRILAP